MNMVYGFSEPELPKTAKNCPEPAQNLRTLNRIGRCRARTSKQQEILINQTDFGDNDFEGV